jgi:hypothetical protein
MTDRSEGRTGYSPSRESALSGNAAPGSGLLSRAEVGAIRDGLPDTLVGMTEDAEVIEVNVCALCDTALRLWKGIDWRIERIVELENRVDKLTEERYELHNRANHMAGKFEDRGVERDRLREDIEHALGHIDKPEEAEVILRAALEADE